LKPSAIASVLSAAAARVLVFREWGSDA
jgi:hypothetical protein